MAGAALSVTETTIEPATDSALDRLFAGGVVLCDGAMGTMLYDRGISLNLCYDELNLSQPQTIASVHAEYLRAGAEIVETNTFGGNAYRLERYGLCDKVREINLAGVRIVRQCVATRLPLAAMPNAGLPRVVEGRNVYSVSPEDMASFAGRFIRAGANLIGGCCGTTPSHTRAPRSAMRALLAQGS
jgi:methionine synthase I (cobalamin-dependent)